MPSEYCIACGSQKVSPLFVIPDVPVHCNIPQSSKSEAINVDRGNISLGICRDCGHLYNLEFNPALLRYGPGYENALDFSPRFRQYVTQLVQRLIDRHDLHGKNIVELACGRGKFLKLLCAHGNNRGVGFDPSYVSDGDADDRTIKFVRDNYSEKYSDLEADLICCRHALEHIPNPKAFIQTIHHVNDAHNNVDVFFEVPNSLYTLNQSAIWDLIYEHCSYFCDASLKAVFESCGFNVKCVREEYEGQFLSITASTQTTGTESTANNATDIQGILEGGQDLERTYRDKLQYWANKFTEISAIGKRIVVWGSGSKGVTFLNAVKEANIIQYAVDINPHKEGLFIAGSGQMIVQPEFLKAYQPDYIIVMNSIYQEEIRHTLSILGIDPVLMVA